ncbi:MAG: hypothetical protein JXB88_10085 [Spirochaetales bacterium]|nr:hypothetical protein [Spirochaetales bacterium]
MNDIIRTSVFKVCCILFYCFFFFVYYPVFCEDVLVEGYEYRLDLPEGWEILDAEDLARISFTDPTHSAVLQIIVYQGDRFFKASDMSETVKKQLKAEGDGAHFLFNMKDSYITELTFHTGEMDAKGYFVFINSIEYDYAVFCFTSVELYDSFLAFIFSAIDSFSLDKEGLLYPGPISQFLYPFPGPDQKEQKIPFQKTPLSLMIDMNEADASQVVIEREAIILASYQQNKVKAWERFFRMIYRDTYHRLDKLYAALELAYQKQGQNKKEMMVQILSWIQDFTYTRTQTIADFLSPLTAAIKHEGDCDSRALLYLILLHHMGADSVLLVSARYSHSAVGVNFNILKKPGATMEFEGKRYLYAELTAKVDIGMIAKDVADPSGWIPIRLGE